MNCKVQTSVCSVQVHFTVISVQCSVCSVQCAVVGCDDKGEIDGLFSQTGNGSGRITDEVEV